MTLNAACPHAAESVNTCCPAVRQQEAATFVVNEPATSMIGKENIHAHHALHTTGIQIAAEPLDYGMPTMQAMTM